MKTRYMETFVHEGKEYVLVPAMKRDSCVGCAAKPETKLCHTINCEGMILKEVKPRHPAAIEHDEKMANEITDADIEEQLQIIGKRLEEQKKIKAEMIADLINYYHRGSAEKVVSEWFKKYLIDRL